jgi:hypothetical protein
LLKTGTEDLAMTHGRIQAEGNEQPTLGIVGAMRGSW